MPKSQYVSRRASTDVFCRSRGPGRWLCGRLTIRTALGALCDELRSGVVLVEEARAEVGDGWVVAMQLVDDLLERRPLAQS